MERHKPCAGPVGGRSNESDLTRTASVEDDDGDIEIYVFVRGMRSGVVELIEDIGVDTPRAPLAVVNLGSRSRLHSDVVGVDLGWDAVE